MDPISLATIPVIGFLISTLAQHFAYGLTVALLGHVVWIMIFGAGTYTFEAVFINWFWATLLFSITGHVMSRVFNWHPLLNGQYLRFLGACTDEEKAKTGAHGWKRFGTVIAKLLVGILLLAAAHIPLELQIDPATWPVWAGGLCTTVALVLVWVLIWAMLRPDQSSGKHHGEIFHAAQKSTGKGAGAKQTVNLGNELRSFIFYFSLTHIIYVTAYWIWKAVQDPVVWKGDSWYFYSSLIIAGVLLIVMTIVGALLSRHAKKANLSYAALNPENPPSAGSPGEAAGTSTNSVYLGSGYAPGTYKSAY